ncbi:MAG: outer membrane beta-barrel protein [Verrucomicrobia bacterium]|nr:outer membrane beta-barrel protein [Verrucomicrobiota bacterium]
MKKIVASVGLVALGTSMIHGVETGALNSYQNNKAWSVSATLRGFYDDNINTEKNNKDDSVGFEVNPSISYGMAGEMTALNFTYSFSGKYYEERPAGSSDNWDFTHVIGADLSHSFSARTSLFLRDSFVVGQEPDVLRSGNAIVGNQRISGNNIRNYASAKLNTKVTELLGFEVGYDNTFFDYADEGPATSGLFVVAASNSGLLDRMQHGANLDSRWTLGERTTGIVGYRFGLTDFNGDEAIGGLVASPVKSEDRNSRSHYLYGGLEHAFSPDISGSLRAGAIYTDYYNDAAADPNWNPYLSANLHYQFLPESSVDVGLSVDQNASDLVGNTADFVRDTQTIVAYGKVSHRIFAQLYGSGSLTYQHQIYNGGGTGVDGKAVDYLIVGLNLDYRFNRNLSTSLGYNFDNVNSDINSGTDYNRNRIYFGVTATY